MSEDSPSPADTPAKSVVVALAAVMDALPGIGKDEKSPEGYNYRGIEAIAKHLQPLLAKHGVVISPVSSFVSQHPSLAMKEGWTDTLLDVDWRIYGPAGDSIEARTQGIGRDKSDKGAAKALTQARKNLLLSLFSIADKADDADGHSYEQDRVEREPAASDEAREKALADVKALSETNQVAVKMWLRTNKVPALTKPGVTLTQLNELADYITQLTTEPFEVKDATHREEGRALTPVQVGDAGLSPATEPTAKVSDPGPGEPASRTDKPFEPVVFNHETGQQEPVNPASAARKQLSGTERKAVDSASKTP